MNIKTVLPIGLLLLVVSSTGCAYRYYLGMHGPSIRNTPEMHRDVQEDWQCLECHNPQTSTDAPPTTHPEFKGCIKCHDDAIVQGKE